MHLGARGFVHPELIDPATGEARRVDGRREGELVLTHLRHRAAPLLRFRTRDHVEVWMGDCRCGRTGPRIRCIGRTDDMLIVRGVNVFPSAVREVVNEFAPRVSGNILVRPRSPGVKQDPPLPVARRARARRLAGRRARRGDPRPAAQRARRADAGRARAVRDAAAQRDEVEARRAVTPCAGSCRPAPSRSCSPTSRARRGCWASSARRRTRPRSPSTAAWCARRARGTAGWRWTRRATRSSSPSRRRRARSRRPGSSPRRSRPGRCACASACTRATPLVTDEGYVGARRPPRGARSPRRRTAARSCSRARRRRSSTRELTDLGEHRLKDVDGAVALFQLGDDELPAARDDREHEPAAAGEHVRRPGARARRGARAGSRAVRGSSR